LDIASVAKACLVYDKEMSDVVEVKNLNDFRLDADGPLDVRDLIDSDEQNRLPMMK